MTNELHDELYLLNIKKLINMYTSDKNCEHEVTCKIKSNITIDTEDGIDHKRLILLQ